MRAGFIGQVPRERQGQRTYCDGRDGGRNGRHGRAEMIAQQAVEHRRERARADGSSL